MNALFRLLLLEIHSLADSQIWCSASCMKGQASSVCVSENAPAFSPITVYLSFLMVYLTDLTDCRNVNHI